MSGKLIEATGEDKVAITIDLDTVICSGRLWMIYHDIAVNLIDACGDYDEGVEYLTEQIRLAAPMLADGVINSMQSKKGPA